MDAHVRDALVSGFEDLVPAIQLPDPDDRHVVAAAIHGEADIVLYGQPQGLSGVRPFPARTRGRASRRFPGPPVPRVAESFPRGTGRRPGSLAQSPGFTRAPPRRLAPGRLERDRDGNPLPHRHAVDATTIALNPRLRPPLPAVRARRPAISPFVPQFEGYNKSPLDNLSVITARSQQTARQFVIHSDLLGYGPELTWDVERAHGMVVELDLPITELFVSFSESGAAMPFSAVLDAAFAVSENYFDNRSK